MANTIDWGQGAVNNTNDWGKGKTNATNNWGAIYDSTAAGETNITGSGGVAPFTNTYSMSFDGIDERFYVGTSSLGITNAITVSAWVKIPTTNTGGGGTNIQSIICEDNTSGGQRNWNLSWRGTGYNYFQWSVWHTNLSATSITSTGVVPNDGFWHHLLGTFDGTTGTNGMKFYIDGVLNGQTTATSTGVNSYASTETTIASLTGGGGRRLEGTIDETAVWDSDQSSNINSIYSPSGALDLSSLNPLSWWRMGDGDTWGGSSWTLTDNGSGGNDATSVNMEEGDRLPISPSSFSLYSFSFDGVDEYIDIGDISDIKNINTLSIGFWFKYNSISTSADGLITKDDSPRVDGNWYIALQSNQVRFLLQTANGQDALNSTTLTSGTWYHTLCVWNGSTMKIYINGTLNNSISVTNATGTLGSTNDSVRIGRRTTDRLNGSIDEVAVWNTDQSSNVSTIFNNGVPQDISSLSPVSHWRMGESATWNGSTWTLTDQGSGGNNATSVNMEEADKTGDQAYVL